MRRPRSERHKLFRAMVIAGSGLSLGCGGSVDGERDGTGGDGDGGAGSADTADSGVSTGGYGSRSNTGGSGGTGSGGFAGGGGFSAAGGATGSGGFPGTGGGPQDAGPVSCLQAQRECSSQGQLACGAGGYDYYEMPHGCACNPARPRGPSDCEPDEAFVCRRALIPGTDLDTTIAFECACAPATGDCSDACASAYADADFADGYGCTEVTPRQILCGCAWVYLQ